MPAKERPDREGGQRSAFEKNKKIILARDEICGICGRPVNKKLKYPHPLSPCVDHIVPLARGGHPSDMSNLQLAHWTCNRQKSDKLARDSSKIEGAGVEIVSNRLLPQSMDWAKYRPKK